MVLQSAGKKLGPNCFVVLERRVKSKRRPREHHYVKEIVQVKLKACKVYFPKLVSSRRPLKFTILVCYLNFVPYLIIGGTFETHKGTL